MSQLSKSIGWLGGRLWAPPRRLPPTGGAGGPCRTRRTTTPCTRGRPTCIRSTWRAIIRSRVLCSSRQAQKVTNRAFSCPRLYPGDAAMRSWRPPRRALRKILARPSTARPVTRHPWGLLHCNRDVKPTEGPRPSAATPSRWHTFDEPMRKLGPGQPDLQGPARG